MLAGSREQAVFRHRARLLNGIADSTAARGDVLVCGAGTALFELSSAVSRKDGVRMRIDESRHDDTSAGFDHLRIGRHEAF